MRFLRDYVVNACVIKMATVTQIRPLNSHVLATAVLGLLSRPNFSLRLTVYIVYTKALIYTKTLLLVALKY